MRGREGTMHVDENHGEAAVWRLVGRLSGLGDGGLGEQVTAIAVRDGRRRIVLDLSGVSLVDAGGVGVLATIYRLASEKKIAVALACVPRRVRDVLAITRLTTVLPMFESTEEALRKIGAQTRRARAPSTLGCSVV
jgi:anti-sigma B factor antagonist